MKSILVIPVFLAITACATAPSYTPPMIDTAGVDQIAYQNDLVECRAYADQRMTAMQGAAQGAVAGAIVGALLAAAIGVDVGDGAAFGATSGGIQGASGAIEDRARIVARCLDGRGYSVLSY